MKPLRYLATALAVFAAFGIASAVYAWSEVGHPTVNGYANCAYIARKIELGLNEPSPKLVVAGGSNVAAGIHVGTLAQSLGVNTFNFSLFATYSPGLTLFEARKVLRKGDAMLLAFEYLAYEYEKPTNTMVDTVYSCGADFMASLSWPQRLFYVFAIRPQRYFSTLSLTPARRAQAEAAYVDTLTKDGDITTPFAETTPESSRHQPLVIRFRADSNGAEEIANFVRWAKANDVTVFATWPNTLYFKEYDANPAFAEIAAFYRALGVPVIGMPRDAMVGSEHLADTIYHLTAPGIALRTKILAERLSANARFQAWAKPGATRE